MALLLGIFMGAKGLWRRGILVFFFVFMTACEQEQPSVITDKKMASFLGQELKKDRRLSLEEMRLVKDLCDAFRRKAIYLEKNKGKNALKFRVETTSCQGKESTANIVRRLAKFDDEFELVGNDSESALKMIETHESGTIYRLCEKLLSNTISPAFLDTAIHAVKKMGDDHLSYHFYPRRDGDTDVLILYANRLQLPEVIYRADLIVFSGSNAMETFRRTVKTCPKGALSPFEIKDIKFLDFY